MRLLRRTKSYTPRHGFTEPVDPPEAPQARIGTLRAERPKVRVFVIKGEIIDPNHPAYRYLMEMEVDFHRHLLEAIRTRRDNLRRIWENALLDAQVLMSGAVASHEIRATIVDRARMASGMRPRARLAPRPIPRSAHVRRLA